MGKELSLLNHCRKFGFSWYSIAWPGTPRNYAFGGGALLIQDNWMEIILLGVFV